MSFEDTVNLIAAALVLEAPSFYPGYRGWDEVHESWATLVDKAHAAVWA